MLLTEIVANPVTQVNQTLAGVSKVPSRGRRDTMIIDIEDYFLKGCGRCERFATEDCSTKLWGVGLEALRAL